MFVYLEKCEHYYQWCINDIFILMFVGFYILLFTDIIFATALESLQTDVASC